MDKDNNNEASNGNAEKGECGSAADDSHESDKGYNSHAVTEKDPVQILQLSQSFFVGDTMEDDDSMMIPPTPDMLIPSTPAIAEKYQDESFVSDKKNDSTISILEETCGELETKENDESLNENLADISTQSDLTQDFPELDPTQEILCDIKTPNMSSPKEVIDISAENESDDDDWKLKFSETQETQEFVCTKQVEKCEEPEEVILVKADQDDEEVTLKKDSEDVKESGLHALEDKEVHSNSVVENPCDKEIESDDEVEPSQSCLSEAQDKTSFATFRLASSANSQNTQPSEEEKLSKVEEISESHTIKDPEPAATETEDSSCIAVPANIPDEPTKTSDVLGEIDDKNKDADQTSHDHKASEDSFVAGKNKEGSNGESKVENHVESNLEIQTKSDDEMKSGVELESASKEENAIVSQLFVKISTSSVNEAQIKEYKSEISKSLDEEGVTESHKESKESEPPSSNAGTPTRFLLPKKPPQKGSLSSRKQKDEEKKHIQDISSEKQGRLIGTFKDNASFEKIFHSFGIVLDHECFETVLSLKPNEETKITKISRFSVKDNKVFLEECLEVEYPHEQQRHLIAISPQSSSSTTTSSTLSTKMSLHSGEIGDVSSSSSSKSANSSGIQMDTTSHSSHIFSSQETNIETFQKTSTQNSANVNSFSGIVRHGKGDDKTSDASKMDFELCSIKIPVSPIKASVHEPTAEAPAPASSKCKKGEKKNVKVEVTGTTARCKRMKPVKRKRGNIPNDLEFKESDSNEESTTKKLPRRKKSKTVEPVTKLQPAKESSDVEEIQIAEDGGGAYEESHFGNIIPGVRVMARWKDGYYYPGTVKSQELEGRWAVLFDDGDLRTIPQENLIKLAMLQLGTSVLVLSADGFYDPGKVCGHFREGNKVGYEVELDNGVTKRYPRTSVILSTEQAKHIISSRPPTTPATMTINLDNIIDGKRKRKSVQSPQSSPVLKKSPRISHRNLKPDSNLDSTSESHVELSGSKTSDAVADVEEPSKKRAVRTRRAAKASAVKTTKAIVQRSKKVAKLFKDYAFLLTNAERKNIPKPVSNESECSAEEYDIIPFDKDELCQYIVSGGGLILDRFDDIQTCTKKNIFLLANSYLRTMKYIQCIAAGIHCIKHHWVQNCIFKGEIMPVQSYYLPAGYSLVTQKIVEWHGKKDVLKGLKIALVSAPESPFVYTWAPVLLASKADFVQKWSLPSSAKPGCSVYVDVLITNGQCPPEILQSAKRRKIPIVSSEWIIQSLISGKCLPFDAHPKFKHDFSE